jgi:hypothetical protein
MNLPELHDATFLGLALRWENASMTAQFRRVDDLVTLTVVGMTLIQCSHDEPWGRSVSVNVVTLSDGSRAPLRRIEIEMQSGDTIRIEGDRFDWTVETLS